MKRPTISTIIIIVCICIIGLYAAGEVNYFSAKTISEKNITSPVIIIEKVGIHEKINNVSLSQGVMMDEQSSIPTKGDVMLFGHRTLQGSVKPSIRSLTSQSFLQHISCQQHKAETMYF